MFNFGVYMLAYMPECLSGLACLSVRARATAHLPLHTLSPGTLEGERGCSTGVGATGKILPMRCGQASVGIEMSGWALGKKRLAG